LTSVSNVLYKIMKYIWLRSSQKRAILQYGSPKWNWISFFIVYSCM